MNGFRQVPPLLQRAGRTLGANGWRLYRHVVLPAAIPGYVGGLQQGWAFVELGSFQQTPVMGLSKSWVYLAMPTGGALIILFSLGPLGRALRDLAR